MEVTSTCACGAKLTVNAGWMSDVLRALTPWQVSHDGHEPPTVAPSAEALRAAIAAEVDRQLDAVAQSVKDRLEGVLEVSVKPETDTSMFFSVARLDGHVDTPLGDLERAQLAGPDDAQCPANVPIPGSPDQFWECVLVERHVLGYHVAALRDGGRQSGDGVDTVVARWVVEAVSPAP